MQHLAYGASRQVRCPICVWDMRKGNVATTLVKSKWSYKAIRDGIMNEYVDVEAFPVLRGRVNTRPVNQKSLGTLAPKKWLNDDVIDNYFAFVVDSVNTTITAARGLKICFACTLQFLLSVLAE
mmetsp:Transcript_31248/g.45649  ORF Transcript_31248/g.45649 Transcript_31248/m.45649 type:complete len:124 (-) Transcript_31248:155-526(-)